MYLAFYCLILMYQLPRLILLGNRILSHTKIGLLQGWVNEIVVKNFF